MFIRRAVALLVDKLLVSALVTPWVFFTSGGWTVTIELVSITLFALYRGFAHSASGSTLGKKLLGLRVVQGEQDRPPRAGTAALRELPLLLTACIGLLFPDEGLVRLSLGGVLTAAAGLFMTAQIGSALFDRQERALHDRFVGTRVRRRSPEVHPALKGLPNQ